MSYDVAAVRAQFPALRDGAAHFDGPGGSQVPDVGGRAVAETLTAPIANRGRVTAAERSADDTVLGARAAMADLLGADPAGVVFGRSMTAADLRPLPRRWPGLGARRRGRRHPARPRREHPALGARRRGRRRDRALGGLRPGDRRADRRGRRRGAHRADPAGRRHRRLQPDRHPAAGRRDRRTWRTTSGALLYVDGVHLTAHAPVDVAALGADFYACSPYKFLGPHCGVLAARPGAAGDPAAGQAAAVDGRRARSGSSSAPCPTSCWRARPRPSTSWPTPRRHRRRATAASGWSPR